MSNLIDWIRPWYPAGYVGHTRADCPDLLAVEPNPCEGTGWLNPRRGEVCEPCLKQSWYPLWDARCRICGYSLREETADNDGDYQILRPFTKDDALKWRREHRCIPSVELIPPTPAPPAQPVEQGALL